MGTGISRPLGVFWEGMGGLSALTVGRLSPMPGDFSQVAQKMRWANHQLTLLAQELAEYVGRQPYVTFIQDKPELQGYEVTARLHEAPPPKLALMAGDFLNNAQGALDYLAWQLVIREQGTPGVPSSFPILLPNEDGTLPSVQIANAKGKPAICDQQVLQALDTVQPYQDGADARAHPLFVLKALNRETKHRHLPLFAATIPAFSLGAGYVELPKQVPVFSDKRFKDEEEVKFLPYQSPPNPRMPEKVELAVDVAVEQIGQPAQQPLLDVLTAIHNRVLDDVLRRFEPFF